MTLTPESENISTYQLSGLCLIYNRKRLNALLKETWECKHYNGGILTFLAPRQPQLTNVIFLHVADVSKERTVSKQDQHDRTLPLLGGRHNVGWVSHHSILIFGPRAKENPRLVLDVENPKLAGHVSSWVNFSSIHIDLPLREKKKHAGELHDYNPCLIMHFLLAF